MPLPPPTMGSKPPPSLSSVIKNNNKPANQPKIANSRNTLQEHRSPPRMPTLVPPLLKNGNHQLQQLQQHQFKQQHEHQIAQQQQVHMQQQQHLHQQQQLFQLQQQFANQPQRILPQFYNQQYPHSSPYQELNQHLQHHMNVLNPHHLPSNQHLHQQQLHLLHQQQQHQQQLIQKQQLLKHQQLQCPPLSHFHEVALSQLDVSRKSFSPHHRARVAAGLARASNTLITPDMYDENAPSRPRHLANGSEHGASTSLVNLALNTSLYHSSSSAPISTNSNASGNFNSSPGDWNALDMTGMQLRNISKNLFEFSNLTTLYICFNQLTHLPPEISLLRSLVYLDASSNKLVRLPSEIGLLSRLERLFLFDNLLLSLPWTMGFLYSLEHLGIENNPGLPAAQLSILKTSGTASLIAHLRDNAPRSPGPPPRPWIRIESQEKYHANHSNMPRQVLTKQPIVIPLDGDKVNDENSLSFSVLCYNILSEKYATQKMYGYTPAWALDWNFRSDKIMKDLVSSGADILCLQEVVVQHHEELFEPSLLKTGGYKAVYGVKTRARSMEDWERKGVDGCAIYYDGSKYNLVEHALLEFASMALQKPDLRACESEYSRITTKDNIAVVALLLHQESKRHLLVVNCHVHWDPANCDVKLVQVMMLLERLESLRQKYHVERNVDPKKLPILMCGDFNSTPISGVHDLLSSGHVNRDHADFLDYNYGNYTQENGFRHSLCLMSAYDGISGMPFTNFTPGFSGIIDYIWYTRNLMTVTNVLGGIDSSYCNSCIGFPNEHFPSDHIPLVAKFRICDD